MPDELKRCPFCNEEADWYESKQGHRIIWVVQCKQLSCLAQVYGFTKEGAFNRWNRRADNNTDRSE